MTIGGVVYMQGGIITGNQVDTKRPHKTFLVRTPAGKKSLSKIYTKSTIHKLHLYKFPVTRITFPSQHHMNTIPVSTICFMSPD